MRAGALLPFRALAYLFRRPALWPIVVAPLAINAIVFASLLGWGFGEFSETIQAWLAERTSWYWMFLIWLARIMFWAVALIVVYFIFTPIALIIAAPFNDWLADLAGALAGLLFFRFALVLLEVLRPQAAEV